MPVAYDLTLGITRDAPARAPGGLHRFEPVEWNGVTTAPGNVTYPTRNFATLGPFSIVTHLNGGLERFRQALHVAMQVGLYHLYLHGRVWRVVSEDSSPR